MASSSRNVDDRYEFRQDNSTISNLVQPSNERRNPDNAYEPMRRNNTSEYTRRVVPTAEVVVDPYRRPSHGNARSCVMEINIAVSFGTDRNPQASVTTNNHSSKPPAIRSTATIDDVRYIDLNFQSPSNTAQLATDGIIRQPQSQPPPPSSSSPRYSTGFQNARIDE